MTVSRRHFLAGTASVAGVGALVACSPAGEGGTSGEGTDTSTDGGGSAEAGAALVAVADVPVGGAVAARTPAGDEVIVAQPTEGTVVAFSAVCPHQQCVVAPQGAELICPCHTSIFDLATGENLSGPAPRPLAEVAVQVQDGQVVLA